MIESVTNAVFLAIASAVFKRLGEQAVNSARKAVFGDPQNRAFAQSLSSAYAATQEKHARLFREFDLNPGFLEHEGAAELAKELIPGSEADPLRLAEACIKSLSPGLDMDTRWDYTLKLRPVFREFLDSLRIELRKERRLDDILGRADAARAAATIEDVSEAHGASRSTESHAIEYLHWLVDHFRYIQTTGMVGDKYIRIPLQEVFTTIAAWRDDRPGDRRAEWLRRGRNRLNDLYEAGEIDAEELEVRMDRLTKQADINVGSIEEGPSMSALAAIKRSAKTLVLGDPGSGKTTFLRYLALRHAQGLLQDKARHDEALCDELGDFRFPIYVRLGEYARSGQTDQGIGRFLAKYIGGQCDLSGLEPLIRRKLQDGRCLVLLDGLDEIATAADRRTVVAAIDNFVTSHSRAGNRFIVTSRIAGYLAVPLSGGFEAFRIQDMDDATIERFLQSYCPAIERAEAPERSASLQDREVSEVITNFMDSLRASPGVIKLAANPLLLTTLLLVSRAGGRLPNRRIDAYVAVIGVLGRTWRSVQRVPDADLLDEPRLMSWLTTLGAWMHADRPEGSASKRDLLKALGPSWARFVNTEWDDKLLDRSEPLDSDAGRGVVEFIEKCELHTGLVVERAPGRYGFAHATFEEFFAGRSLAVGGDSDDRPNAFRRRLHNPRYDEPILLGLGLVGKNQPEEVESLVEQAVYPAAEAPSQYEELLGRDFRFALRVLADDVPVATATVDCLVDIVKEDWVSACGRGRFRRYRDDLGRRLAALGATSASERLLRAVEALSENYPESLPQLVGLMETMPWANFNLPRIGSGLREMAMQDRDLSRRLLAVRGLNAMKEVTPELVVGLVGQVTAPVGASVQMDAIQVMEAIQDIPVETIADLASLVTASQVPGFVIAVGRMLQRAGQMTEGVTSELVELAKRFVEAEPADGIDGSDRSSKWEDRLDLAELLEELRQEPDLVDLLIVSVIPHVDSGITSMFEMRRVETLERIPTAACLPLAQLASAGEQDVLREMALRVLDRMEDLDPEAQRILKELADSADSLRWEANHVLSRSPGAREDLRLELIRSATDLEDPLKLIDSARRLEIISEIPQEVYDALGRLASGDEEIGLRVRAARFLSSGGRLSRDMLMRVADATLVYGTSWDKIQIARIQARLDDLPAEWRACLEEIAGDEPADMLHRIEAIVLLAESGVFAPELRTLMIEIIRKAKGRESAGLHALLAIRPMPGEFVLPLLEKVAVPPFLHFLDRQLTIEALQYAETSEALEKRLIHLFRDDEEDVRIQAGRTLVELARRHPSASRRIADGLAEAVMSPSDQTDGTDRDGGSWDYAYEALWDLVGSIPEMT